MFAGGQHSDSFWGKCLAFVPSSCNIHCPAGFVFQEVPVCLVLRLLWSNVQAVLLIQMRDHILSSRGGQMSDLLFDLWLLSD